jgi:hypothetical protein
VEYEEVVGKISAGKYREYLGFLCDFFDEFLIIYQILWSLSIHIDKHCLKSDEK